MIRVAAALERFSRAAGIALAWLGVPSIVILACLEPISRWGRWGSDLPFGDAATSVFFVLTMMSFGYAYVLAAHVRLDILSRRLSPRANSVIELAGVALIVVPLCVIVILDGSESAWLSYRQSESWGDTHASIQWLVRASVPAGFLLLLLAGIASALRAIETLIGK